MRDYQKKTIDTYNKTAQKYKSTRGSISMQTEIEKFQALLAGKKILDLGCGPGRDVKVFVENGFQVTGIDLSEEMIKLARDEMLEAEFIVGDLLELPFEDQSFDGVWSSATIHHLKKEDIPIALSEINRVLKKNGAAYISVKRGDGEIEEHDSSLAGQSRFFSFFTAKEMTDYLNDAGFDIIESWESDNKRNFAGYQKLVSFVSFFIRKK